MADIEVTFFEDLSTVGIGCPHNDAFIPDGTKEYFRVLKHDPACSDCFLPTVLKEGKPIPDVCIAKSVSIYDNLEGMINGFFKTPAHKKKERLVAVLPLTPSDGLLKQTFAIGHHSWWRSQAFVPATVTIKTVEA